jgi:hypothetical protein
MATVLAMVWASVSAKPWTLAWAMATTIARALPT